MTLTFGSLFTGIGGLDLGLERAGMRCLWQSEIDPYACRILNKHWPDTPNLGDIRDINWEHTPRPDLICGGYPCQPFSTAGQRHGTLDPRHLWPMFADAIRTLRPRYALMENVTGHLSLGFGSVLADLAQIGYDTEWDCIPAAAVGAPHRRDRVFIIATSTDVAHTTSASSQRERTPGRITPQHTKFDMASHRRTWQPEPGMGRVAHGIPHRLDRLRTLGNAVVPQVAQHIAQHIINHHNTQ